MEDVRMVEREDRPREGTFGVLDSYGYDVVEIIRVTDQCFYYAGSRFRARETRAYLEKLACWSPDRAAAERASERLKSAGAERDRRTREACLWFQREKAKIALRARSQNEQEG